MSVPLLLYLAGTLPVTAELEAPDDAPVELVAFVAVLPLSLLEPHPVSATRQTAKIALVRTARDVAPRMFASSSVGFQRGNPTHYVSDRRPSQTANALAGEACASDPSRPRAGHMLLQTPRPLWEGGPHGRRPRAAFGRRVIRVHGRRGIDASAPRARRPLRRAHRSPPCAPARRVGGPRRARAEHRGRRVRRRLRRRLRRRRGRPPRPTRRRRP